jgi:hypothetical protein
MTALKRVVLRMREGQIHLRPKMKAEAFRHHDGRVEHPFGDNNEVSAITSGQYNASVLLMLETW